MSEMQEAGYILLMPGGDWNADTTYHILHLVNHNGASWLCKVEECTGQEPSDSNTAYWQRFGTAVDLSNYALLSHFANRQLKKNVLNTEDEINAFYGNLHTNASDNSVYEGWVAHNVGHSKLGGGQFYVFGARTSALYGWQKATSYDNGLTQYERSMNNGVWSEWEKVFTTKGGTVSSENLDALTLKRKYSNVSSALKFENLDTVLGYVGFDFNGRLVVFNKDNVSTQYPVLHTGNKPTGTYTGNGSATQRYINTGGIGDSILIQGNGYETIVTKGTGSGGNKTAYKGFGDGEVYFAN